MTGRRAQRTCQPIAVGGSASVDLELNLTTESVSRAHLLAPICVEPATPLREVFERLKGEGRGSILVCRDGSLVGIFTERDALRLMAHGGNLDVPVESVMVRNPATIDAEATVADAIGRMTSGGFRRLPIINGDRQPIGVVQVASIVHYLVEHFPKTIYNQPVVSHPVTQQREGP